eukprot:s1868_g4.t1
MRQLATTKAHPCVAILTLASAAVLVTFRWVSSKPKQHQEAESPERRNAEKQASEGLRKRAVAETSVGEGCASRPADAQGIRCPPSTGSTALLQPPAAHVRGAAEAFG